MKEIQQLRARCCLEVKYQPRCLTRNTPHPPNLGCPGHRRWRNRLGCSRGCRLSRLQNPAARVTRFCQRNFIACDQIGARWCAVLGARELFFGAARLDRTRFASPQRATPGQHTWFCDPKLRMVVSTVLRDRHESLRLSFGQVKSSCQHTDL